MRSLLFIPCFALACASHEPPTDGTAPTSPTTPAVQLRGAVSSVNLVDDCPEPETPAIPAEQAAKPSADVAPGAALYGEPGPGFGPGCTQSTVQLTLAHDGRTTLPIAIAEVRVVASGKAVGKVSVRAPQRWEADGRYSAWDQTIPAGSEVKASYRVGLPDWKAPEVAPDGYGRDLVLEVDVVFEGRTITLRSSTFQRERPHVVVT